MPDCENRFAGLTVGAAQRRAAELFVLSSTPMLDARILMRKALGVDDATLIADENRKLTNDEGKIFALFVKRRRHAEPVAYIVGVREFWGLEFMLEPGILVPRADSETLINVATQRRPAHHALRILDLGTGSGCLLSALLFCFPEATGVGVDINPQAVQLARRNLANLGLNKRGHVIESNWIDAVSGQFDVVVSNPPYIPSADLSNLPDEVRLYEDHRALLSGADGLQDYQTILTSIRSVLAQNALIIFEIGDNQSEALQLLFSPFEHDASIGVARDLNSRPRAIFADFLHE